MRGGEGVSGVRVRGGDGELFGDESELTRIWKGYFEELMNNEAEGEVVVTSMGNEAGRGWVPIYITDPDIPHIGYNERKI